MLSLQSAVPKTPHTKLKNENQLGGARLFPKTPLPKQFQVPTTDGKPSTSAAASRPRKGLGDKTVTVKNRSTNQEIQIKDGKSTISLVEKAPSASRKSVKQPRFSGAFQQQQQQESKQVDEGGLAEKVAEIKLFDILDDDDLEPEYMPPTASVQPLENEYDYLMRGEDAAKAIMEIARVPFDQFFGRPPLSFNEEAFFLPDEYLEVPLSPLDSDSSDEEERPKSIQTATSRTRRGVQNNPVPTRSSLRLAQKAAVKPPAQALPSQKMKQKQDSKLPRDLIDDLFSSSQGTSNISATTNSEVELLPELKDYLQTHEPVVEDFLFDDV
ncbi:hypothetical protein FRC15_009109 [Serendipita sp. 397]|nr:hypothetical protein FRC15_009109 [Serendipita sp. 397]KAG8837923.1 hypothetical protein FRC18_007266 [Serendipita sp. 400]